MRRIKRVILLLFVVVVFNSCEPTHSTSEKIPDDTIDDFLGQWTLEIEGGWVGWLEVRQEEGYLDADLLWKWGSVLPASHTYIYNNSLRVTRVGDIVREKDENGKVTRVQTATSILKIKHDGKNISGYFFEPANDGLTLTRTAFKGFKLPDIPAAPDLANLKFGEPVSLFNGTDLTGWELTNKEQVNGFMVENGIMINDPVQPDSGEHINYGNIRTEAEFEDFNLRLEVNIPEGSNSGIYLRGIYEVQVYDTYGKPLDSHHMGGLYSRIAPSVNAEKPAGEWQTFDITLCDRHVTVILNGTTIIDNQPVYGPTGGALHADVTIPGPIYLQGDHGKVMYRNMVLTPIIK